MLRRMLKLKLVKEKTKSRTFLSRRLKDGGWRKALTQKTWNLGRMKAKEKHNWQLLLIRKSLSSSLWRRMEKMRNHPIRKDPSVGRVVRSLLAPLHLHLGAQHQPSLVMLITRGLTRTDILLRGEEWMLPQREERTKKKRVRRRRREVKRRILPSPLPGGGVPGLRPPLRILTAVRAGSG